MAHNIFQLPGYYADGMIVQQKVRHRVTGICEPEKEICIQLFRQPADGHIFTDLETQYGLVFEDSDKSDRRGRFNFRLPALEASLDPYSLVLFTDKDTHKIEDILAGEVWFTAGQDNMAMPAGSCDMALRLDLTAVVNHIRIFSMSSDGLDEKVTEYSYYPVGYIASGRWYRGSYPEEMALVSGIAYSFALKLEEQLHLPIGMYDIACGGTNIHSWLPREIIEQDPYLKNHVRELHQYRDLDNWNSSNPEKKKSIPGWQGGGSNIAKAGDEGSGESITNVGKVTQRLRRLNLQQQLEVPQSKNFQMRNQPAVMFNHKLTPFIGLGVRGVLWYQGESDAGSPEYYARAFPILTSVLKEMFIAPDDKLYLIYSQIAAYCYQEADFKTVAEFNEILSGVRRKLALKAGMVTISDLPLTYDKTADAYRYPAHPLAKEAIGRRMANVALGLSYEQDLPSSAPEPKSVEQIGNKFIIDFGKFGKSAQGLIMRPGTHSLEGFAICGEDRVVVRAKARILYGVKVIVWHDELADPVSLTYGYSSFNREANLCGPDGMPVPAFRLDTEPSEYYKPEVWMECDRVTDFAWFELMPDPMRVPEENWPGDRPLWKVSSGRCELDLTDSTKTEGGKVLQIIYRSADDRPVVIEPQLTYVSSYPPLDLSGWEELHLELLNPDLREKKIGLEMEDENQVVYIFSERVIQQQPYLQTVSFSLSSAQLNLERIVRISFAIQDQGGKGCLDFEKIYPVRRFIWQE
ncbi:MAG: sialate O-acetylesterase [Clostridiaceae bacterium]|nr:sialate O-acetylesterase [Clostridiaceae bacterium]